MHVLRCVLLFVTQPTRLLSPWDSPGKNTGVGSHGKQILYINAYRWNLERKWLRQTYLQSRNRDTDLENKRMDTAEAWDGLGDCG